MTREIVLTRGKVALVDARDYEWLAAMAWCAHTVNGYRWVAVRGELIAPGCGTRLIYMHRVILEPPAGLDVDHINGDALDNRRCNLRACTRQENLRNKRHRRAYSSRFKGVWWSQAANKWVAAIAAGERNARGKSRSLHLGVFVREEDAARAYDRAALQHFGAFACTNFPREEYQQCAPSKTPSRRASASP